MTSVSNNMTAEEFEAYAAKHGRCELIHGEVRALTFNGFAQGAVSGSLLYWIGRHVMNNRLGDVLSASTGFYFDDEQGPVVRAPDIAFVSNERLPKETPATFATFAPDLVVETISPNDKQSDVSEKVLWWLSKGVKEAWVADPANKTITLHHPDGNARVYTSDQVIDDSQVLPGLTVALSKVFTR